MDTTNSNQKEIDEDLHMANQNMYGNKQKKNTQKKRLYLSGLLSLKPE